jgi:hypothetical protein
MIGLKAEATSATIVTSRVAAAHGDRLVYDSWPMLGITGGPVIDLDTGCVIGVHFGVRHDEQRRTNVGVGLAWRGLPEFAG